jgi:hypothetical protein
MTDLKIALIHATPLAVAPVSSAFERLWPQVQRMNLLDDSLGADLAAAGGLSRAMVSRMVSLAQYAKAAGARGILFTCSAFGPAIDEARQVVGLPTLKPNEAMFDEALDLCDSKGGACRIGLVTTFAPATRSMTDELLAAIAQRQLNFQVDSICAPEAMQALNAGDAAAHDQIVLRSARSLADCDVLLLGQFSMARALTLLAQSLQQPVLTSP